MTDIVCFKAPASEAARIIEGLKRDYYNPSNPMAVGEPVFKSDGFMAVFYCPVFFPVSALKRVVEPLIIKGFKSSFSKAGIVIERVRVNKVRLEEYVQLSKKD